MLKKLNKEENLTILSVTHDIEDTLYGNEIVVMDKGKVVLQGTTKDVLKKDKLLVKLGLDIPFMVKLSIKLKYYGLLKDIELVPTKLVDEIWK